MVDERGNLCIRKVAEYSNQFVKSAVSELEAKDESDAGWVLSNDIVSEFNDEFDGKLTVKKVFANLVRSNPKDKGILTSSTGAILMIKRWDGMTTKCMCINTNTGLKTKVSYESEGYFLHLRLEWEDYHQPEEEKKDPPPPKKEIKNTPVRRRVPVYTIPYDPNKEADLDY